MHHKIVHMNKLDDSFQKNWINNQLFDPKKLDSISKSVKLHTEINNVRSSAAACLNVLQNLSKHELFAFLNQFDLEIEEIIQFPTNANVLGEIYDDKGYVVFEWIGPQKSPINEKAGKRGLNRTSIDAFVLAKINNKITQILIEWKFTESYSAKEQLQRFSGLAGNERLRRYSNIIAKLRKTNEVPFNFEEEGGLGIFDFGYEPFYQLMRMTLLAKMTTPISIDHYKIEDYRILHLSHSENQRLNILEDSKLKYCPYLKKYNGADLHQTWTDLLSNQEKDKFKHGFWNLALDKIQNQTLKQYLTDRYK